jgi:hypothetical protein
LFKSDEPAPKQFELHEITLKTIGKVSYDQIRDTVFLQKGAWFQCSRYLPLLFGRQKSYRNIYVLNFLINWQSRLEDKEYGGWFFCSHENVMNEIFMDARAFDRSIEELRTRALISTERRHWPPQRWIYIHYDQIFKRIHKSVKKWKEKHPDAKPR